MESLGYFCHLIAVVVGLNCVKGLKVTKNVKEVKIKYGWGKLE